MGAIDKLNSWVENSVSNEITAALLLYGVATQK